MGHKTEGKEVVTETKSYENWGTFPAFCISCSSPMLHTDFVVLIPKAFRLTFGDPSAWESIWTLNFAFCFLNVL